MFAGDLARALLVKPVPGRELKTAIGAGQGSLETSMEKPQAGLDHDHSGSAAIGVAIRQPKEGHGLSVAGRQSAPVTLAWATCGRDQSFCEACCKADMSCFNSATMFRSLRFSACENASRLITLPPGLPWLCSSNRDFAFGVFNAHGKLIAVLSLSRAFKPTAGCNRRSGPTLTTGPYFLCELPHTAQGAALGSAPAPTKAVPPR
jgi:hypothetical protein